MIRYALALALAVAVVGMGTAALDQAAAGRGEQTVEAELATVEAAAVELAEEEDPDPAANGPRRFVELDLPGERRTVDSTDRLQIEPAGNYAGSTVTYEIDNRGVQTKTIPVPIRHEHGGAIELGGRTGTVRLVLRLVSDPAHGRVIEVETV